jgi:type 1 fimbria pilin
MQLTSRTRRIPLRHLATLVILNLGAASLDAQQRPVKMTFSGTIVATTINLEPNTVTDEEHLAGNGTLGRFTFHKLRADAITPQPSAACSGPMKVNFLVVAGRSAGVFRFRDGSLLTATVTEGALCIDLAAQPPVGRLTETYQITGGTGRFKGAAATCGITPRDCVLKLTETLGVVSYDSSGNAKFLTATGEIQGAVSRLVLGSEQRDELQ